LLGRHQVYQRYVSARRESAWDDQLYQQWRAFAGERKPDWLCDPVLARIPREQQRFSGRTEEEQERGCGCGRRYHKIIIAVTRQSFLTREYVMKEICLMVAVIVVSTFPQMASAAASVDAIQLGELTKAVDSCGRIDPRNSDRLTKVVEKLTKGLTEKDLNKMRHTADFSKGYASMGLVFQDVSGDDAVQLCASALK
jgi:hypothetical protein